jgi:integrase
MMPQVLARIHQKQQPPETEGSRKPVPLGERVAAELWFWKESSKYQNPNDWIFARARVEPRQPFWPDMVLQKIIRPAALRVGISKVIGWHTFRHTYSTLLIGNGENVKVVQELMRHASTRFTPEVYTQARIEAKRHAQQRWWRQFSPTSTMDWYP